jgi:hypothetical protein
MQSEKNLSENSFIVGAVECLKTKVEQSIIENFSAHQTNLLKMVMGCLLQLYIILSSTMEQHLQCKNLRTMLTFSGSQFLAN